QRWRTWLHAMGRGPAAHPGFGGHVAVRAARVAGSAPDDRGGWWWMKQLGALVLAVSLVVGAALVRGAIAGGDGGSTGDGELTVVCPPELEDACAVLSGDVEVRFEPPRPPRPGSRRAIPTRSPTAPATRCGSR